MNIGLTSLVKGGIVAQIDGSLSESGYSPIDRSRQAGLTG